MQIHNSLLHNDIKPFFYEFKVKASNELKTVTKSDNENTDVSLSFVFMHNNITHSYTLLAYTSGVNFNSVSFLQQIII